MNYKGKKITVFLNNNYVFEGKLVDLKVDSIEVIDKNKDNVVISLDNISHIKEVKKVEEGDEDSKQGF